MDTCTPIKNDMHSKAGWQASVIPATWEGKVRDH